MATIPSFGNISYPKGIHQRFFKNRKLIANIYKQLGSNIISYCISISKIQDTNELIKLTKRLVNMLCISESHDLLFTLNEHKLILDKEIVLHLKKLNIQLKD